ncbi:YgaP family membrane protein [Gaoshiqia sp. Z1-71]|uniref:YgaP family membrane protein n=1 Tax=Gaoshiqia hydrogeniformans TaxID=3290090 RepID=UPI003BF8AA02
MKKNMGMTDRTIRAIIAVIIAVLHFTGVISGTLGLVLLIVACIFLLTGFLSFCPLYLPFGCNTLPKKAPKE